MKNIILKNKLFFPDLTPPKYLELKDIVRLIIRNGLRTFLGALFLFTIFLPFGIISTYIDLSTYKETGTYEQGVFGITTSIVSLILFLYFLISVGYTIINSWKWYFHYFRNRNKISLIKEYRNEINSLEKKLKSEYLQSKLENKDINKDLKKEFEKKENEIYKNLEKRFKTTAMNKSNLNSSKSIDEKIQELENEFSNIIDRQTNFKF